jgi:hypothetical protein
MAEAQDPAPLPGFMPNRLPENAPRLDFDPISTAKALLRVIRSGALATIDRNTGHPFASLVNVATDADGSPLILISRLSSHTANLETDGRASVLMASTGKGDPLAHPRLTVIGAFRPVARDDPDEARVRRRFLRGCAVAFSPAIRRPSFMPASPIFRSGGLTSFPPISMPGLPARPI